MKRFFGDVHNGVLFVLVLRILLRSVTLGFLKILSSSSARMIDFVETLCVPRTIRSIYFHFDESLRRSTKGDRVNSTLPIPSRTPRASPSFSVPALVTNQAGASEMRPRLEGRRRGRERGNLHEKANRRSVSRSCWDRMKKCKRQLNILLIRLCRVPASVFS